MGRAVSSLRDNPRFRLLWASNLFFFGGVWTQTLVLGWLIYETTHSDFLVAVFTAVRLAPMLLGPYSGVFADRHDRVRLLIVASAWPLVAVSVIASLISLDLAPYWALIVAGGVIGIAESPSRPARSSLVLDLVGRGNLSNANALNAMAMSVTQVIGPAIGGLLISWLGAAAALWISTAWYAISLSTLLPLRGSHQLVRRPTGSATRMMRSGLHAIVRNRLARTVLLITLAANIFLWPIFQGFMPVFAKDSLGLDAAGLGWLLTCSGVGGLLGSLCIAFLGDFRFKGGLFVLGTITWAGLWAGFALSHDVVVSFVLMGMIGLTGSAFGVLQITLTLMTTEPEIHGRALGLLEFAIGIMPISALVLGVFAERFGVDRTTFVSALALVLVMSVLAVRTLDLVRYSGRQDHLR
ncbi:MAG: MFS transporter [Microlunatus sp.]|nr:MFS transporter [Microlunatus sp.]MDN5769931.1 MFS transporter [Microlunatus sp.]